MLSAESSDSEGLAPLSQDTYEHLMSQIPLQDTQLGELCHNGGCCTESGGLPTVDSVAPQRATTPALLPLPTLSEYAGLYGFGLEFGQQPKLSKSSAWCYSPFLNRLYIQMHKPCELMFLLSPAELLKIPSTSLRVRAVPVFVDSLQTPVERCPNHLIEDAALAHCRHLVWSTHPAVAYETDSDNRHSTVVPYQTRLNSCEPEGCAELACRSTVYAYSFKCRSTCTGSLNRRAVSVIFSLESFDGAVLGRRVVELRVCTCPGRDMTRDESSQRGIGSRCHHMTPPCRLPCSLLLKRPLALCDVNSLKYPLQRVPAQASSSSPLNLRTVNAHASSLGRSSLTTTNRIQFSKQQATPSPVDTGVYRIWVRGRKNFEILARVSAALSREEEAFNVSSASQPRPSGLNDSEDTIYAASTDSDAAVSLHKPLHHLDGIHSQLSVRHRSSPLFISVRRNAVDSADCRLARGHTPHGREGLLDNTQSCCTSGPAAAPGLPNSVLPTVQEWLDTIGLIAYTDDFLRGGYRTLADLQDEKRFTLLDLQKLRIAAVHRSIMWKSLLPWRVHS